MGSISVFLSDFQFLTRQGFEALIERQSDFVLAGAEEDLEELPALVRETDPDVLVIDYRPSDKDFLNRLERLKEVAGSKLLIITGDTDRARMKSILKTGVKGMVTKTCSEQEIINSIYAVAEGNRFYCNKVLDVVMEDTEQPEDENCAPTDLSPREYEVLQLITKGLTTTLIADELHVSVHTINSHRKNILKKLNLRSPTELIVYAMESGIVR
ncbi:MAG: response regulator transcription factor [Bacteroidota bacterium]